MKIRNEETKEGKKDEDVKKARKRLLGERFFHGWNAVKARYKTFGMTKERHGGLHQTSLDLLIFFQDLALFMRPTHDSVYRFDDTSARSTN